MEDAKTRLRRIAKVVKPYPFLYTLLLLILSPGGVALVTMGGGFGVARVHLRAVGMALREAVLSHKAVQVAPGAVPRDAHAHCHPSVPDILPDARHCLGVDWHCRGSYRLARQLLPHVHQTDRQTHADYLNHISCFANVSLIQKVIKIH